MNGRAEHIKTPLVAILLILSLAGTSVNSQTNPTESLRTVRASECRPQSVIDDIIFTACSTINSPSNGEPWCLLPKANVADPDVKALCIPESIPVRNARVTGTNESVRCDASTTPPGKTGVVFGCFTTRQVGGQMRCSTSSNGLLPCLTVAIRAPDAVPTSDSAAQNETDSQRSGDKSFASLFSGTTFGMPTLAFYGIIAVVVNVILIAVGVYIYKRRKRGNDSGKKGPEESTTAYKEMMPSSPAVPGTPSLNGLPSQMSNINQRTSSQYGPGSRMSFADGPAPPMPAPTNVEGSLGKYLIASTYTPTLDDEIVIQPGDVVEVFQEFDDGWCSAVNMTRGMTRGVFPMHCIDEERGRLDD